MRSAGDPLWPVLVLLALLLGGTVVLEALARSRQPESVTVEVRGLGTATSDDGDDGDDSLALADTAPINEEHARARLMARRGDLDEALTVLTVLTDAHPDAAVVHADLGYWLIKARRDDDAVRALDRAWQLAPSSPLVALNLGAARRRVGDVAGAEQAFRAALELRPGYGDARRALAQALRKQGREDEAVELLLAAASTGDNAERAVALVSLGSAYLSMGRAAEAEQAFTQAIERAPADVQLRAKTARAWLRTKRREHASFALAAAERAAALAPEDAEIQVLLARARERSADRAGAREAYARAVRLDPTLRFARQKLVRLALDRDDFEGARAHAQELVTRGPDDSRSHFLAGLVAARAGRSDESRQHYTTAIAKADGDYPEAFFNLGLMEKRAGDLEAAIEAYRAALDLRPEYVAALNNLGLALAASGRDDEAEATYRQATEIDADYAPAWKNLADLCLRENRPAEAVAALKRALSARPGDVQIQLDLGAAYRAAERWQEASNTYRALLASESRNAPAWFGLGQARMGASDLVGAGEALRKAVELAPDAPPYLRARAEIEERTGDLARARSSYEDLLDHVPADAGARLALAGVLRRAGDHAACRQEAARVLRVEPSNAEAANLKTACEAAAHQ